MQWKITLSGDFSLSRLLNPLFLRIVAAAPSVQRAARCSSDMLSEDKSELNGKIYIVSRGCL